MESDNTFLKALRDWKIKGENPKEIIFTFILDCINEFVKYHLTNKTINLRDSLTMDEYISDLYEGIYDKLEIGGGFKYLLNLEIQEDNFAKNQIIFLIKQVNDKNFLNKNPLREEQKNHIDLVIENIPFFMKFIRVNKFIKLKEGTKIEDLLSYIDESKMHFKEQKKEIAKELFNYLLKNNGEVKLNDIYRDLILINELSFTSIENFINANAEDQKRNQPHESDDGDFSSYVSEDQIGEEENEPENDDDLSDFEYESEIEATDDSIEAESNRNNSDLNFISTENVENIDSNNTEHILFEKFFSGLNETEKDLFMITMYYREAKEYLLNRNESRKLRNSPQSLYWYICNEPDRFLGKKTTINNQSNQVINRFKEFYFNNVRNNYSYDQQLHFMNYMMEKVINYFGGYDD